jgi:uncharacterized iron-regulated membrane protein
MSLNRWSRKLHRWGAIITLVPLGLVIGTGLLLQLKKQLTWVQPATERGSESTPTLDWNQLLESVKSSSDANIQTWDDIDRIDVRPSKGVAKVRGKNRWEVQVDTATGKVLATNFRRSDLIESLHDGSFFADWAKVYVFLPNGVILLGLWISGAYLWWLPIGAKRKKKKKKLQQPKQTDIG